MFTAGLSGGNGQQAGGERPPQREVKRSNLSAAPPPSTTKVTPSISQSVAFIDLLELSALSVMNICLSDEFQFALGPGRLRLPVSFFFI